MRTLGITGGIGSGKSYFCEILSARGIPVFSTDDSAKRLMRTDKALQESLTSLVGSNLYDAEGRLVKSVMAAYLCGDSANAARVNALVHPRVADDWREWCRALPPATTIAVMECAILFETHFDALVDSTLLVSAPEELRIARVMERDSIDRPTAMRWLQMQWTDDMRRVYAHIEVVNDGRNDLQAEADRVIKVLIV